MESGSTPGYQPDEDTLVQRYTLTNETWLPFNGPIFDSDNGLIRFTSQTSFGTITLSGYVSDHITPLPKSNRNLTPQEVKFDIVIDFTSQYKDPSKSLKIGSRY